jgi:hypothetical protein
VIGDALACAVDLEVHQAIKATDNSFPTSGERVPGIAVDDPFGYDFVGRPLMGYWSVRPTDHDNISRSFDDSGR